MKYEKVETIIIIVLDTTLAVFKGVKKLRAIVMKKSKKFSNINDI